MTLTTGPRAADTGAAVLPRELSRVQVTDAATDGLVLSTITVHALLRLHLSAGVVGAVLAAAAAAAVAAAPLFGAAADRLGLRRAAACYALVSAVALAGYATAGSPVGFAAAAVAFVTAQAAAGSTRHAIAVAGVTGASRTELRASMHTALNAGFGCGTLVGVLVLASASDAVFTTAYLLGALLCAWTGRITLRLPAPDRGRSTSPSLGAWVALRDRPFVAAVGLACLVQLTMPILSVLLPLSMLRSTAPSWTAALAMAVNTALVISVQCRWTARLTTATTTARSAAIAAAAILTAGLLLSALPRTTTPGAGVAVTLAAVVAVTACEVTGGAAVWQVALQRTDPGAEGRYQAAFSTSASGARVLGPLLALPLVVHAGAAGWVLLTGVMGAACVLVARLSRTTGHT